MAPDLGQCPCFARFACAFRALVLVFFFCHMKDFQFTSPWRLVFRMVRKSLPRCCSAGGVRAVEGHFGMLGDTCVYKGVIVMDVGRCRRPG